MPETEVNLIQQNSQKDSKLSNYVFGFGLAAAIGTTAFLTVGRDYLPEIGFDTENTSFGSGGVEEVYVTDPSPHIRTTYQTGWARVEDDSPLFLQNPFAQEISVNQIKIMHDAGFMRVYERYDEKIGAYVYVGFYDKDGDEVTLAPRDLYLRASSPETCLLDTAEDGSLTFKECTDEDSPDFVGARAVDVDSGGWFNVDTSMIEKVAAYGDIYRSNNSCINGNMMGGVYEGQVTIEEGPDVDLMQERNLGMLRAHYRRSVASQLDVPVNTVLFKEDVDYFTRLSDDEMFTMSDGLDYRVLGNMFRPAEPQTSEDLEVREEAIELDDSIAEEIIMLKDIIADVKLPDGLNTDATKLEAQMHAINTVCYPGSDLSHTEFEQLLTDIRTYGAVCSPEGLKPDGTVDLVWAEEQTNKLRSRVSDRIGEQLPKDDTRNCGDTLAPNAPQTDRTSAFSGRETG